MKRQFLSKLCTAIIFIVGLAEKSFFADNLPPSFNPPGGLTVENVPQFINFGFDDNMWAQAKMSKQTFVQCLKYSLEHRLNTNRAPFLIGAHSDYYSEFNDDANNACAASYTERREAVEEFIDYALTAHKDIRFVTNKQIIQWMREPIGLDATIIVADKNYTNSLKALSVNVVNLENVVIQVPDAGIYSLCLYSVQGRKIRTIAHSYFAKGASTVPFNRSSLSAGLYFIRLKGVNGEVAKRVNIVAK